VEVIRRFYRYTILCTVVLSYAQGIMVNPDLITVYRSSDANAETDATAVCDVLTQNGIDALLCDDEVEGVLSGTWEVRVDVRVVERAEALVATLDQDDPAGSPNPSHELDSVTLAEFQGTTGEIEAMGIYSVLQSSGIPAVLVGSSSIPVLSFMVKVGAADLERAREAVAEAQAAGPAGAFEAEQAGEASV